MLKTKKHINDIDNYTLIKDRIEIYKDFTLNLLYCIYDYYLDKETLFLDQDIKNHFMFCYNKICDEFLKEDINFKNNNKLINYFYVYYYHHFYKIDENVEKEFFIDFWNIIFNVNKHKNKNMLRILIELYKIFDESIKIKKLENI